MSHIKPILVYFKSGHCDVFKWNTLPLWNVAFWNVSHPAYFGHISKVDVVTFWNMTLPANNCQISKVVVGTFWNALHPAYICHISSFEMWHFRPILVVFQSGRCDVLSETPWFFGMWRFEMWHFRPIWSYFKSARITQTAPMESSNARHFLLRKQRLSLIHEQEIAIAVAAMMTSLPRLPSLHPTLPPFLPSLANQSLPQACRGTSWGYTSPGLALTQSLECNDLWP